MPRLDEDSATGAGRIATRRLDADDRVRVGLCAVHPTPSIARGPGGKDRTEEKADASEISAKRLVQLLLWKARSYAKQKMIVADAVALFYSDHVP